MLDFFELRHVVRRINETLRRVVPRHDDFNIVRRVADELEYRGFRKHALVDDVKHLVEHDHVVPLRQRDRRAAVKDTAVHRRCLLLFMLVHVVGELQLQRTVGHRHPVERVEYAAFARALGLEELHKHDLHIVARRADRQARRSGRFALAVSEIYVNHRNNPSLIPL